jgi:hypothetical protein
VPPYKTKYGCTPLIPLQRGGQEYDYIIFQTVKNLPTNAQNLIEIRALGFRKEWIRRKDLIFTTYVVDDGIKNS